MTEIKKARLSKIILIFDDGSTVELSDDDIIKMSKNSLLAMGISAFVMGVLEVMATKKKETEK
jgi:hypothetical protein